MIFDLVVVGARNLFQDDEMSFVIEGVIITVMVFSIIYSSLLSTPGGRRKMLKVETIVVAKKHHHSFFSPSYEK